MITFLVLLRAAKRLEPLDAGLARETYLEALSAAAYDARFVTDGVLRQTAAPGEPGMGAGVPARDPADANVLVPGGGCWHGLSARTRARGSLASRGVRH
jgi:hypothetical protein